MVSKKQIFITGTTGISGGWAVNILNQRQIDLRIMTRQLPVPMAIEFSRNTYVEGDLAALEQLKCVSRSNAGIIHYACASLGGKALPQVDIDAMEILLNNWEEGPFIFISSLDVYGAPNTTRVIDETYPLSGRMNAYAESKVACEALLFEAAKQRGRNDFTIFRAPWIFAPSLTSKQHIQRRFLEKFASEIILPGATLAEWTKNIDVWVDARDLAWLVAGAVTNPLGGSGNVVGEHFNWHDFFSIINVAANLNLPIIHKSIHEVETYAADLYGQTCVFSGKKIQEHYQFEPKYRLEDTLKAAFSENNEII